MKKFFKIGDFTFEVSYPETIVFPPHFLKFEVEETKVEHSFKIVVSSKLPKREGKVLASRMDLLVLKNTYGEIRYMGVKNVDGYYACSEDIDVNKTKIKLNVEELGGLSIDPIFTSLFSLEKYLMRKKQMVLHCAYIEKEGEAILFTAPSETGKTTQANLWEKYQNTVTVNGDRSLLKEEDGIWYAQGWPVCGTSEICNNKILPIRSIVILSQGKENVVKKIKKAEAFKLIYSQITINRWNALSHIEVMNLIEKLIEEVEVYHLSCTISKEAVDCLYNAIYKKKEA